MENDNVKLPFGIKNGELVHISIVPSGLACECYCPCCEAKLIARKGEKNAHGFAHYQADECEHGLETALHLAAKKVLENASQITLPELMIEEQVSNTVLTKKDSAIVCEQQTVHIDYVILETPLKSIIPDVIAYIYDMPILLEIAVTHFVDKEKLNKIRNLGISCIEIDLRDVARNADLETIYSIVVDSVKEKKWLFHTEAEKVRVELKTRLKKELEDESKSIYQAIQERRQKEQEYKKQQDDLLQRLLKQQKNIQKQSYSSLRKSIKVELGIPLSKLPDFLNHPVNGEDIFSCERKVWQAALFLRFIFNKIQKYNNPYPISITKIFEWSKKYIPNNLNRELENANRYTAIQEFLDYLEVQGFIEKYNYDKYNIINDTLCINDDSNNINLSLLSEDELQYFEERAAIYQFEAGLTKKEAEELAYQALKNK